MMGGRGCARTPPAPRDGPKGVVGKTGTSQDHPRYLVRRAQPATSPFAIWIVATNDRTRPICGASSDRRRPLAAPVAARIVTEIARDGAER